MKKHILIFFFIFWFSVCQLFAQKISQDTLPDNHLLFTLNILNDRLEGANEYLEGFKISMDLSNQFLKNGLDINNLMSIVRNQEITGTVTYPNGRTTQITYVVIQDDKLFFVINWWYCPPARKVDLETLKMTEQLLADATDWHKKDDRICENDIESNSWSLFCALKYASIKKMGEYNHHNTAMQTIRFVIDDLIPDHGFEHTLMDYNNLPSTEHKDILSVLTIAKERIIKEIKKTEK
jgi:hypothetical protein